MTETRTVTLCSVDSLDDGVVAVAEVDGATIAYARIGDEWLAIDDTCSHAKVSLADGIVDTDDCTIECPKHGALFSLRTGEALTLPATKPVQSYATTVVDGEVRVEIAASGASDE